MCAKIDFFFKTALENIEKPQKKGFEFFLSFLLDRENGETNDFVSTAFLSVFAKKNVYKNVIIFRFLQGRAYFARSKSSRSFGCGGPRKQQLRSGPKGWGAPPP